MCSFPLFFSFFKILFAFGVVIANTLLRLGMQPDDAGGITEMHLVKLPLVHFCLKFVSILFLAFNY